MGHDQVLHRILADSMGIKQEKQEYAENKKEASIEEPQTKEVPLVKPEEIGRTQEIVPGISGILAPVGDVTGLIAALTKEKLTPVDAAKQITDLTYENRQKNAYIEKLQKLTEEAKQRGENSVVMPMMPPELIQAMSAKKEGDGWDEGDIEDRKFMRDSFRLIRQHKMLLDAQNMTLGAGNDKNEPQDWIEVTYPDGTTFKGPSHLAPQPVQQPPQNTELTQILSTLIDRIAAIEKSNENPNRGQPMIRIPTGEKDDDGDVLYADVPMAEAMRYGLMTPPQAPPASDERLITLLEQFSGRVNNQQTAEEIIDQIEAREARDERKMEREMMRMEKWKNIFNPTPTKPNPDTGRDETAIEKARIAADVELKKAKIEKESKTLDLVKSALEPDPTLMPQRESKQSIEEAGRKYLAKIQEQARREAGLI